MRPLRKSWPCFAEAGVSAEAFETGAPGSAMALAEQAVSVGFDTVLACGGDGTVHEIVQSLVGTDVALGVVPLGTANALAADLGLIAPPAKVARKLLQAAPTRVSVGTHSLSPTNAGIPAHVTSLLRRESAPTPC